MIDILLLGKLIQEVAQLIEALATARPITHHETEWIKLRRAHEIDVGALKHHPLNLGLLSLCRRLGI